MERKIAPDLVAEVSAIYDKMKNTLEDSAYAYVSLSNETNMQKFPRTSWDENYTKWMSEDIYNALHKENEIIDASLEKYPQLKAFHNDPKQKGYDNDMRKADHIGRLFYGRSNFEKYLVQYIKS